MRSLLADAVLAGESLTSGERRLSGFLLWQSTHAELQFCDTYWPGFRRIDLLRALRAYALRRSGLS